MDTDLPLHFDDDIHDLLCPIPNHTHNARPQLQRSFFSWPIYGYSQSRHTFVPGVNKESYIQTKPSYEHIPSTTLLIRTKVGNTDDDSEVAEQESGSDTSTSKSGMEKPLEDGEIEEVATEEPKAQLPIEIWEMILDSLFTCTYHQASRTKPCMQRHTPPQLIPLLPLRQVNHYFNHRLTPPLFHHMTAQAPRHRHRMLKYFAQSRLTPHIRALQLEISPNDLGGKMRRITQAFNVVPEKKLLHYYEILSMVLGPILKHYTQLRLLHITTTYQGLVDKRLPTSELLPNAFFALCECVRRAQLEELNEVMLGVPYEGGYTTFFDELDDKKYEKGLRSLSRGIRTAAVKLCDNQGNFTTFPFF